MGEGGGEGGTATAAPRLSRCRDRRDSPATGAAGSRCAHKAFMWALFLQASGASLRGAAPGPRPGRVGGGCRVNYRDRGLKGRRGPGQEPSRGLWGGGGCTLCGCQHGSSAPCVSVRAGAGSGSRSWAAGAPPPLTPTRPRSPLRPTAAASPGLGPSAWLRAKSTDRKR